MKLKYEYKGNLIQINIKSLDKLEPGFKVSLKRKLKISINDYLLYLGLQVEKCRICDIGDVPISIDCEIINDFIIIKNFKYTKKIYCYGSNTNCEGIKINPNSFEFISKTENVSLEEAKKILKNRNSSPFYKENWKSERDYKEYQKRDLDFFIMKYNENGDEKYKEYKNKLSYSNSLDRYIDEFGEKGKDIFKDISLSKDSMSYSFFLKKNNNKELALIEYKNRLESVNNSVDKWIRVYGEKEALKKHEIRAKKLKDAVNNNPNKDIINKSKGITIDKLYKKYGDINIANKRYREWLEKVTIPFTRASKESLLVFLPIIEELNEIDIKDIYIGYGESKEFFIRDNNNIYFYDFTIRSKKIIIEYNGILFHPKNENHEWVNPFDKNITSIQAYNKQKNKIELAKRNGFSILEIWSDDDDNYKKALSFIKKNI